MPSAAAAQPAHSFEIVPSQYVVMPQHGICVVTGYNSVEAGGFKTDVAILRPVKDLKSTIMKPTHRLAQVGVRLPMDAQSLQDILRRSFSAVKTDGGGRWHKREDAYQELLVTGGAENMAIALNKVLSKHRLPKWTEKNLGSDLPTDDKANINYSERQIANAALKQLSEEISHATGLRESEARSTILRAAMVPGYAAKIKLNGDKAAPALMDAKLFKDIFGHAPGALATADPIKVDLSVAAPVSTYHYGHERGTAKRFSGGGARDATHTEKKVVRQWVKPTAARPKAATQPEIPAANRMVFAQEAVHAPAKGIMRGLFMLAARILDVREFEILSRTALRSKSGLENMKTAAEAMGMDVAELIEIRNEAAQKVASASPYDLNAPKAPKILRPYEEAAVKEKAPRAPKPPKEPKAPRVAKEKYDVAEGNRELFRAEEHMAASKGMTRGLFLTAARVLEPQAFQIVTQAALRRGGRLSMEQVAASMDLSLEDAIALRNNAMAILVEKTGYDPDGPRAPSILKPYEIKPVFERAAKQKAEPAPKIERGIAADQIELMEDGDDVIVMISVPKSALEKSHGLKLNIDWNESAEGLPKIVKAEGGIKSRANPHAAKGNAEFAEPAIQPPPSTLDPS